VQKILPTPWFDLRTVQPTASIYTNYTTPAHPQKKYYLLQNTVSFREKQWDTLQPQDVCMFAVQCSGSPHELKCQVQGEPHWWWWWWWWWDTTEVNACHLPSSKCLWSSSWIFSIGLTVAVLQTIWQLSLPEALHLFLQLLPSRRPVGLNIHYIQRMYLIKWFTDMEVSAWWVRRITGFVRESTLGSVELRQASFLGQNRYKLLQNYNLPSQNTPEVVLYALYCSFPQATKVRTASRRGRGDWIFDFCSSVRLVQLALE